MKRELLYLTVELLRALVELVVALGDLPRCL